MALKLNKAITKAMEERLKKLLDFEVGVEAELSNLIIKAPSVTVELHIPYSVSQELLESSSLEEVKETFTYKLAVCAIWSRVIHMGDQDTVEKATAWKSYDGITKNGPLGYKLGDIAAHLYNIYNGTDQGAMFLKTLEGVDFRLILSNMPEDTWRESDRPALKALGEDLGKNSGSPFPFSLGMYAVEAKVVPEGSEVLGGVSSKPMVFVESDMSGPVINLGEATMLYQPVKATSEDSVYHVVGLYQGLNLAARIQKSGGISIRAEGSNLKGAKSALEAVGMSVKSKYASMHLHTGDSVLQCKTLGAILLGLDMPMLAPPAVVSKIIGKGK